MCPVTASLQSLLSVAATFLVQPRLMCSDKAIGSEKTGELRTGFSSPVAGIITDEAITSVSQLLFNDWSFGGLEICKRSSRPSRAFQQRGAVKGRAECEGHVLLSTRSHQYHELRPNTPSSITILLSESRPYVLIGKSATLAMPMELPYRLRKPEILTYVGIVPLLLQSCKEYVDTVDL